MRRRRRIGAMARSKRPAASAHRRAHACASSSAWQPRRSAGSWSGDGGIRSSPTGPRALAHAPAPVCATAERPRVRLHPRAPLRPLPELPLLLAPLSRRGCRPRREEHRHDRQDRLEEQAIRDAHRFFAETLTELGLMAPSTTGPRRRSTGSSRPASTASRRRCSGRP